MRASNAATVRHLEVPVPSRAEQASIVKDISDLQAKNNDILKCQEQTALELDALIPSVLDHAFRGEL
jgi:type I restriction enzyme S subunit